MIDNGTTRAALIGADQTSVGESVWADGTKAIAGEFQIPAEQVLTSPLPFATFKKLLISCP